MKTVLQEKKSGSMAKAVSAFLLGSSILMITTLVNAQPGPPAPRPGTPPPPPNAALQQVTAYQGKVVRMDENDDYVYDGFILLNSSDSMLVKFPPHLGTQVISVVKPGATVTVNGVERITPRGEKEIRMLSINASGKTIADAGVSPQETLPAETYVSATAKISQLQTSREGEANGLILDSKTILRIPPHVARQLGNSIAVGASISYTGMKKTGNNGEAMSGDYSIVHCKTITLNGQQYMVE